ncbi:hypothetical protein PsYK624_088520 [Phanerochaete sordida]|uniref:Uncharacterized protein n=1 Tax=Phanerochaete sordida TaxID=48140 RepID=A0A9P3LEM9_9APHY|nr:hypothetical protein PsYK624_088520 [Phanerochaete sordida]
MTGAICDFHPADFGRSKGVYQLLTSTLQPCLRALAKLRPLRRATVDLAFPSRPAYRATLRIAVKLCMGGAERCVEG